MSNSRLVGSTLIMAAGTLVSRATGFIRGAMIAAVLGVALTGEMFNVPNTIPNSLYILVAGGVLNAVLVPQLVRAIKHDPDGGEAYAQRLSSAVLAVLVVATAVLIIFAPQIVSLYVSANLRTPEYQQQFDTMVMFARFCLPQVFFYGMYVLIGQILNAHNRFGPMMWSPILNNIVAIAIFGGYYLVYGAKDPYAGDFSTAETMWFGLGSTLGIVLQAVVLLPLLGKVGIRMRLRTDLRGVGLGRAARLSGWTMLFVVVNQITYLVIVHLATWSLAQNPGQSGGSIVYGNAFLVIQVPHSVFTVSIATALLPRLSTLVADTDRTGARQELVSGLRTAMAVIVPAAGAIALLAEPLGQFLFGYGAAAGDTNLIGLTIIAFAPGLVAFTAQYLLLRGFYANEDTKTPLRNQLIVGGVQMAVALALVLPNASTPAPPLLAVAYSVSYIAAAAHAWWRMRGAYGPLGAGAFLRFLARIGIATAVAVAVAGLVVTGDHAPLRALADSAGNLGALVQVAVAGIIGGVVYLGACTALRVPEVTGMIGAVRGKLGR